MTSLFIGGVADGKIIEVPGGEVHRILQEDVPPPTTEELTKPFVEPEVYPELKTSTYQAHMIRVEGQEVRVFVEIQMSLLQAIVRLVNNYHPDKS